MGWAAQHVRHLWLEAALPVPPAGPRASGRRQRGREETPDFAIRKLTKR